MFSEVMLLRVKKSMCIHDFNRLAPQLLNLGMLKCNCHKSTCDEESIGYVSIWSELLI